jgi:glycosyltransferase involved in cell wall biosynthesis
MKVVFVYSGGREARGSDGPSDFFYGAREIGAAMGWDVGCIDLDPWPADPVSGLVCKVLAKYLPPRTSADWVARCRRVLPRLRDADVVVATATEISFGLAIWKALGFFKKPIVGILCGAVNYPIGSGIRRRIVANLLGKFRPVLFADVELPEIERRFGLDTGVVKSCWFGVDEGFWTLPQEPQVREGVLAVGNDSRRDFGTLVEAARSVADIKFTVVTRRERPANLPANVEWRRGDWKEAAVSDQELRGLYQRAACVVVPLEECIQPSGQSVAMQAMMCGAPVVHSRTAGWWGADLIRDGVEVSLVDSKDSRSLAEKIRSASSGETRPAAREALLRAEWTCGGFAKRLCAVLQSMKLQEIR